MDRRRFLARSLAAFAGLAGVGSSLLTPRRVAAAPALSKELLEKSPFVYVSPLRSDGNESTCHAEVWYAWLDDAVVLIVSSDRWKARAIDRGLSKTRIWVGNHGRWKGLVSNNEEFRKAPSFVARGERVKDAKLLDRLLASYETKYPAEIGSWRDRMRNGYADGSRVLIRYRPEKPIEAL